MQAFLDKIKKVNWADRRIILVIVIVVLVFLMMDFNNRMVLMLQLESQEEQLITKKAELQKTIVKVEADIAYATSDRALEEWAREKARLVAEGDYPIVIIAPMNVIETPIPEKNEEVTELSRFEIWKELFWGDL